MITFLWQGLGAHKSCLGPEMPGWTEQVKTVIICHSYHRQLMYTALYNSLSFYQWKYSCQKKRKRKPKKWCGRFPHLILIQYLRRRQTSASMPRENIISKSGCVISYPNLHLVFLSCSLTCFSFAFFMNNCLSRQYHTQQVSCFQQRKKETRKLPFMGKSFLKEDPSHWHKSTKSKCIHLAIQKVLICHHVM